MTVANAKAETQPSALTLLALAASDTPIYLHYVSLWVAAAACVATVVVRRVLGEAEGSPLLSAASSVSLYSAVSGVMLFPVAMVLVGARVLRSVSNHTHAEKGIKKEPPKTPRQIVRKFLKDPFMIGTLAMTPFLILIVAGQLVVLQSPEKGSRTEQIGSVLKDVGVLGSGAAYCFVNLPTLILRQWRMK